MNKSNRKYPAAPTPRCRFCSAPMQCYDGESYCAECVTYGLNLTIDAITDTLARALEKRLAEDASGEDGIDADAIIEEAYLEALREDELRSSDLRDEIERLSDEPPY